MTDIIQTERLVLRRFETRDVDPMALLLNNLEVARWLTLVPHPYDADDARAFFDLIGKGGGDTFAVTLADRLIGCVSIGSQLGYWYGQPFWGCGYATEAGRAMVARHFARASEPLQSGYHLGNDRSGSVLQKLGFAPTDQCRKQVRALGQAVTIQNMELTHARWERAA